MKKYLFCGDIHCKYELFKSAVDYGVNNGYTIVSVGDYVDSWDVDKDGIEGAKARRGQMKALELAKWLNENGHYALKGNHELSYLSNRLQCSGYQPNMAGALVHKIKNADLIDFKFIYPEQGDPILVTHAGLSQKWLDQVFGENYLDNHDYKDLENDLQKECESYSSPIYDYRHMDKSNPDPMVVGTEKRGGIFWNRPDDFKRVEGLRQIFGHTNTIYGHFSGNSKVAGIYNFEGRKKDLPNARNFNIDNIEVGLGEVLTYDEETDQFGYIEKDIYGEQ